ncbi:hypothetical protein [Nitrosopumilus sp.]
MNSILIQKCHDCGKKFQDWGCDHCYTRSVIEKSGVGDYDKTR